MGAVGASGWVMRWPERGGRTTKWRAAGRLREGAWAGLRAGAGGGERLLRESDASGG